MGRFLQAVDEVTICVTGHLCEAVMVDVVAVPLERGRVHPQFVPATISPLLIYSFYLKLLQQEFQQSTFYSL